MPRPKFRCHVSLWRASPDKSAPSSSASAKADYFCSCCIQALAFVVVLPGWEELEAWRALKASPHLRRLVVVAAADHGALPSLCCPSVWVLQTQVPCLSGSPCSKGSLTRHVLSLRSAA